MKVSAIQAGDRLKKSVQWIELPIQANPESLKETFSNLSPRFVLVVDFYEADVRNQLPVGERQPITWGYGIPGAGVGLRAGWSQEEALKRSLEKVVGILSLKPRLTDRSVVLIGDRGSETLFRRVLNELRPPRWNEGVMDVLSVEKRDDRTSVIQNIGLLSEPAPLFVYLESGPYNDEYRKQLGEKGTLFGVQDFLVPGQKDTKVIFSLEKNWGRYWETLFAEAERWDQDGKDREVWVPMEEIFNFSQENVLLKPSDIR